MGLKIGGLAQHWVTEVCNFLYWSSYCLVLELFVNPSLSSSKPVFLNLGSTLEAPREF